MNGGKIINEGAYGCIYNPALKCSEDEQKYAYRKNKIHKLQIHNEYSENELSIGKAISKLPDYEKRFSPLYSKNELCTKLKLKQFKNGTLHDCSIMAKHNPTTKVMLLEGNYIENATDIQEFVQSLKNECEVLNKFIHIFSYVTQSIQVLLQQNIIHFDLRNPNIVYDKSIQNPIILDFGISFNVKDMISDYERVFIGYNPKYYIYPPEVLLVSHYIFDNKNDKRNTQYSISKVYSDTVKNYLYTDILPENIRESYKIKLTTLFETIQDKKSVEAILKTYLNSKYYQTWDIYIFSVFILRTIQNVYQNTTNTYIEELKYLCYQCLNPIPSERPSIEDVIIHCEKIDNLFNDHNNKLRKLKKQQSNPESLSSSVEEYSLRDSL